MLTTVRHPWQYRFFAWSLGVAAAVLVLTLAPPWLRGTVRMVAAYDAGAILLLAFYFFVIFHGDETRTRKRAAMEDPGRNLALSIIVVSIAAGLAGAIVILGKSADVKNEVERGIAIGLAIAAVIEGWFLIHSTFALRYAHLFYGDDVDPSPGDGLTFPKTSEPDDYDFLYFSFVIGMTFQVSYVQVNDSGFRRTVLFHGLISFVYNTAILALGVNLVSNLLH